MLISERFLNSLPSINPDDFRDYIWDNNNETLRNDLNYTIKRDLDKAAIIEIARENPDWIKAYGEHVERKGYTPYSLKDDPLGKYLWASDNVQGYIRNNPLHFFNREEFSNCILNMCLGFKNFIENNKGYELLWDNKQKSKPESAVQLLLYGVTKAYCMFLDIDITRESNAGSGPVDFKYSQGYSKLVLIGTKLIRNTRYWNGLEKQLPQYMLAEGINMGIFMLIAYTADEFNKANKFVQKINTLNLPYSVSIVLVDASTNKMSASIL